RLLDLFTTSFNDNAARGRLPINQTNLAAWSAVLSGVVALQADTNANASAHASVFPPTIIEPAGAGGGASPLGQLVTAINEIRRPNYAGTFKPLGDILSVPELTTNSPFLNLTNVAPVNRNYCMNDTVAEWLPQQILGLLSDDSTPRFVIYSFGQALKPAERSIQTSGSYFGMCTNYQVTAEVATRTVVRVEGAPDKPHVIVESFNVLSPD